MKTIQTRVNKQKLTMVKDTTNAAAVCLHEILTRPSNYSMLFGRIHVSQQTDLDSLPQSLSVSQLADLYDYWREYAAMALDLYSVRNHIVSNITSEGTPQAPHKPYFHRGILRARERLCGIEHSTVLHSNGTIVQNTKYDTTTIIEAGQRLSLNPENCILLRPRVAPKQPKPAPTTHPPPSKVSTHSSPPVPTQQSSLSHPPLLTRSLGTTSVESLHICPLSPHSPHPPPSGSHTLPLSSSVPRFRSKLFRTSHLQTVISLPPDPPYPKDA